MKLFKKLFFILSVFVVVSAIASIVNHAYAAGCVTTGCPGGKFTHQCVHYNYGDVCDTETKAIDCCGNYQQ